MSSVELEMLNLMDKTSPQYKFVSEVIRKEKEAKERKVFWRKKFFLVRYMNKIFNIPTNTLHKWIKLNNNRIDNIVPMVDRTVELNKKYKDPQIDRIFKMILSGETDHPIIKQIQEISCCCNTDMIIQIAQLCNYGIRPSLELLQ